MSAMGNFAITVTEMYIDIMDDFDIRDNIGVDGFDLDPTDLFYRLQEVLTGVHERWDAWEMSEFVCYPFIHEYDRAEVEAKIDKHLSAGEKAYYWKMVKEAAAAAIASDESVYDEELWGLLDELNREK